MDQSRSLEPLKLFGAHSLRYLLQREIRMPLASPAPMATGDLASQNGVCGGVFWARDRDKAKSFGDRFFG